MDYRAALGRAQAQPPTDSVPSTNAPQYRKKEADIPAQTTATCSEHHETEAKPERRPRKPKKSTSVQQTANLADQWSNPINSSSSPSSSQGTESKKPRRSKKTSQEVVEAPKPNTFDKIKALHAERNAALLQRLQELGASSDDSDEDESDLYGGISLSESQINGHLRTSSNSSVLGLSSSTGLSKPQSTYTQNVVRCSICLDRVKTDHPTWQCTKCFCDAFHLPCIVNWIHKESLTIPSSSSPLNVSNGLTSSTSSLSNTSSSSALNSSGSLALSSTEIAPMPSESASSSHGIVVMQSAAMLKFRATYWQCPNCRGNHERSKAPKDYFCFCGKTKDPVVDPWKEAHTCGLRCERELDCGHFCPDLCHVGRCVTCAIQTEHSCFCGANMKMLRCIDKKWSCGERCGMRLACGKHRCALPCHDGPCPPCEASSEQACRCGGEVAVRSCVDSVWQCAKICGASLGCEGGHTCLKVCHAPGECGECVYTQPRTCFCGKQTNPGTKQCRNVELSFGCRRTCLKPLSCGVHACERPCHAGECGACTQISSRYCACGKSKRETPCAVIFRCTKACELLKSCGRHKCGARCCTGRGTCPPCTRPCERKLDCGLCTCKKSCHDGLCEPCTQTRTNRCRCGHVTETVPCSPKRTLSHLVQKSCLGAHITQMVDCGSAPYLACQQPCGNLLACGNCYCQYGCHEKTRFRSLRKDTDEETGEMSEARIEEFSQDLAPLRKAKDGTIYVPQRHDYAYLTLPGEDTIYMPPNASSDTCTVCTKKCLIGYTTCAHLHQGPCHLNECPPCNHILTIDCHCMRKRIQYECKERLRAENFNLIVQSCKQACPWKLSCSHSCTKTCHSGKCTEACIVPTRITCKCKTRKNEIPCHEAIRLRSARKAIDNTLLDCEEECYAKKAVKEAQREATQREQATKTSQLASEQQTARNRKQNQNDIFNQTASSSSTSSQSSAGIKPYKAPFSWKLTKKQKNILYACIFGFVIFLLGFLVYLDRTKSIPSRRMR